MRDPARELARDWLDRAVEFRYPDALPLMPLEPAQMAVDSAERIYAFALARLENTAP